MNLEGANSGGLGDGSPPVGYRGGAPVGALGKSPGSWRLFAVERLFRCALSLERPRVTSGILGGGGMAPLPPLNPPVDRSKEASMQKPSSISSSVSTEPRLVTDRHSDRQTLGHCYSTRASMHSVVRVKMTRSSDIADSQRPRDAPCQLKPCLMSHKWSSNCIW